MQYKPCLLTVFKNIVVLILVAVCFSSFAQTTDSLIKKIRVDYKKINSDPSLKAIALKQEQFLHHTTDGGGSLSGYFKHNIVCKMVLSVGVSYSVRYYEYYLKNNRLIFVYEHEDYYPTNDATGRLDYSKLTTAFEGRYYFDRDKLIASYKKGKKRFESGTGLTEQEILSDAQAYLKRLKYYIKAK